MHDIFVICPVRNASLQQTEAIEEWVREFEADGKTVYWPARDTNQDDANGYRICRDNADAIKSAKSVHVWFDPASQGSLFDIGMAFALEKPIRLINRCMLEKTEKKSFQNVLLALDAAGGSYHQAYIRTYLRDITDGENQSEM